jgi:hypothetical protein
MSFMSLAAEEVRERDLEADADSAELGITWDFITATWAGTPTHLRGTNIHL